MKTRTLSAAAILCAVGYSASGIVIRDDRPDSSYIALGAQPQFACVGRLVNGFPQDVGGTLIAQRWVVTAAHCADIVPVSSMTFFIGGNPYSVDAKYIHPGWNSDPSNGNDIALLHLTASVTNVAPAVRATGNEVGQNCTIIGWGQTGTGTTGNVGPAGTKRGCTNVYDLSGSAAGWNDEILLCDFDDPNSATWNAMGSATPTDLEGGLAFGDSGGGSFIQSGSQWLFAGVHSFVGLPQGLPVNYGYGSLIGDTRVSTYNSWIDGIICYANCDGSTATPILNVNDFICFQTKFAAGDPYANCDGSTTPPILNVNDFICFQTKFAQGCP